ncbi:MAG: hypothetical protein IT581_20100 [Verrucomicrobiales bacterium]|nr:hypothetical protein [Verrucomicrobiales bacterium]
MPKFLIECTEKIHFSIRVEAPSLEAAERFYNYTGLEDFETNPEAEYELTGISECQDQTRVARLTVDSNGIQIQ